MCYTRCLSSSRGAVFWKSLVGNKCYREDSNNNCNFESNQTSNCSLGFVKNAIKLVWKNRSDRMRCAILATVLSLLCYVNSIPGDFVHDDIEAIVRNPDVTGNNSWWDMWKNDFWGQPMRDSDSHKSYRPLTVLTYRLNYRFIGDSYTFHVVNIIIHGCCLYNIIRIVFHQKMFRSWDALEGYFSILLFAVHPVHVEAVSSLVGRAELLCGCFFFYSLRCFLRFSEISYETFTPCNTRWRLHEAKWLALCVASAALSLLSKEQGITVLPICILMRAHHLFDSTRHLSSFSSPLRSTIKLLRRLLFDTTTVILSIASCCLLFFRIWMLNGAVPQFSEHDNPASFEPLWSTRFMTYCHLCVFNLRLLLYPSVLSYDWQMGSISLVHHLFDLRNIFTVITFTATFLIAKLCLASRTNQSQTIVLLGLSCTVLPYLPSSNVFVTVGFVVAERVLYLPSFGSCLLVGEGLRRIRVRYGFESQKLHFVFRALLCIVVGSMLLRTLSRNSVWRSRQSLFESSIRDLPNNAKLHYNYANLQKDLGNAEKAIEHYRVAIQLCPNHASAFNNLGTLLSSESDAEDHFRRALEINKYHSGAHFNLATIFVKRKNFTSAKDHLRLAVQLDSAFAEAYSTLANVLLQEQDLKNAEQLHLRALELDPASPDIRNNYGAFLQSTGRLEEAVEQYRLATESQPNHSAATVNLARTLQSLKLNRQAEVVYERAIRIERDASTLDSLASLRVKLGRLDEAKALFKTILKEFPNLTSAQIHYAQLLIQEKAYDEAEEILIELMKNESTLETMRHLSTLYAATNRTKLAKDMMEKAIKFCASESAKVCAILYSEYADVLKDLKLFNRSAKAYREAVRLDPSLTHAHLNLGVILHVSRDFDSAMYHYTIAQALDPENDLVRENISKLTATLKRFASGAGKRNETAPPASQPEYYVFGSAEIANLASPTPLTSGVKS